ncbi:putative methyltransferase NSUN7 isoform X2 [Gigantopelta aegis]|uniref:putative methyltransferase NSUN7 isoform X2 n=1 Tax=Gigantopelta aegis TaxID=1735272 RepID=UPI001B88C24A|nr:putative methyltransferase NSUN7 isoform X2 [Gigantopelta aegis]
MTDTIQAIASGTSRSKLEIKRSHSLTDVADLSLSSSSSESLLDLPQSFQPSSRSPCVTSSGRRLHEKCDATCHAIQNYMLATPDMSRKRSLVFFADLTKQLTTNLRQNEQRYRLEFFQKVPAVYTHRVFVRAAKLYKVLKHEPEATTSTKWKKQASQTAIAPPVADEEFQSAEEKKLSYELAFRVLKYQTILDQITEEVAFFSYYPELQGDQDLVLVMLCDFQKRKFQPRTPIEDEELDEVCMQVEEAILNIRVKLDACLARHRIKASAPCIECLLPESIRQQGEKNYKMPVYMWVNQLKSNMEQVVQILKDDDFVEVPRSDMDLSGKEFMLDNHCDDLLVFPADLQKELRKHRLIESGKAVLQDKSSCLAPHSAKHLLNDDDDIIHVNIGSGLTTVHLASLLSNTNSNIWAFSSNNPSEDYRIHQNFEFLGAKRVKLVGQKFLDIDPDDHRFKQVRAVMITAACSKSAVMNPVEFVINEGEDMNILKDLSSDETNKSMLSELVSNHSALLRHALKINKSQAVVYYTRSVYDAENENVVQKAVEFINMIQQKKVPFRLVPPVLPFNAEDIEKKDGICGKYMKFSPGEKMNGCFVAVITRETWALVKMCRWISGVGCRSHSVRHGAGFYMGQLYLNGIHLSIYSVILLFT